MPPMLAGSLDRFFFQFVQVKEMLALRQMPDEQFKKKKAA